MEVNLRYAIIADIHSNIQALNAVLEAVEQEGCDHFLCLGDVVGYGARPDACLDRLSGLPITHVQGNHEARLLELDTPQFSAVAEAAILHNRNVLGEAHLEFLRTFRPQERQEQQLLLVHGSPQDRDEYVRSLERMKEIVRDLLGWICFCGHTHIQFLFDGTGARNELVDHELRRNARYLINPGSVGQPRDGDVRAAYAILDVEAGTLGLRRVEYDIEAAQREILAVGLPEPLARRLSLGR
jgi:diadenosine tetraphosphatase ApaH/serine/threonine PP2A family protein phosphatase